MKTTTPKQLMDELETALISYCCGTFLIENKGRPDIDTLTKEYLKKKNKIISILKK